MVTAGAPRKMDVGLFTFSRDGAQEVVKLGPFDAGAIQNWATNFSKPTGGTPLGNALRTVSQAVLNSPMPRKHVLIITDGDEHGGAGSGRDVAAVNQRGGQEAERRCLFISSRSMWTRSFRRREKARAQTWHPRRTRTQLNSQLDFILQNQILLEKPSKTK